MSTGDESALPPPYYFAYGTYLDSTLLADRMPGAEIVTTARAVNRSLLFLSAAGGPRRGWCHLADRGEAWGKVAYGLVVSTTAIDSDRFGHNEARYLTVYGDDGATYECWTYCLQRPESAMRLPADEWEHICAGAAQWRLPDDYRDELVARHHAAAECSDM